LGSDGGPLRPFGGCEISPANLRRHRGIVVNALRKNRLLQASATIEPS
jgi:hypothetical protein